jgi:hypothetical protein
MPSTISSAARLMSAAQASGLVRSCHIAVNHIPKFPLDVNGGRI